MCAATSRRSRSGRVGGESGRQVRDHAGGGPRVAADLGPLDEVALEATGNTCAIAALLASHAGRVVVSNPVKTRAIAEAKIKDRPVDPTSGLVFRTVRAALGGAG
jgi:hypothetical protein